MKLEDALSVGKECGCSTVEQTLFLINHNALSIFNYDEMVEELQEMYDDWKSVKNQYGFTNNTSVEEVIESVITGSSKING